MSLFLYRPLTIRPPLNLRTFTTTPNPQISLQLEKNDPSAVASLVPTYPYGPAQWYKQSSKGLYGGQRIKFGNNVGEKSKVKSRRSWSINVFRKKLFSQALGRFVQVRVAARVLRTIDKVGGLDEYLLGEKEARVRELGESGWWLRWAIMQTPVIRKRFAAERERLGLPPNGIEEIVDELETTEEASAFLYATAEGAEGEVEAEEEALLDPSHITTDDAFTIEQPESFPRLKFRVGPGAHLVLTPQGWRRTKPDYKLVLRKRILRRNERIREYVDSKLSNFSEAVKEAEKNQAKEGMRKIKLEHKRGEKKLSDERKLNDENKLGEERKLSDEEKDMLKKQVGRVLRREMKGIVERRVKKADERRKEGMKIRRKRTTVRRASRRYGVLAQEKREAAAALN